MRTAQSAGPNLMKQPRPNKRFSNCGNKLDLASNKSNYRTFGRELVALHATLFHVRCVFGACLELVWRFEQRASHIGSEMV